MSKSSNMTYIVVPTLLVGAVFLSANQMGEPDTQCAKYQEVVAHTNTSLDSNITDEYLIDHFESQRRLNISLARNHGCDDLNEGERLAKQD